MDGATKIPDPAKKPYEVKLGPLSKMTGFLLRRLHNLSVGSWNVKQLGDGSNITAVQAGFLILIDANPGITQSQLAPILDIETPSLVRSISRLSELGLIEKQTDENDRRSSHLFLTANGKDAVKNYKAYLKQREAYFAEALTPEEVDTLQTLLKKMLAHQSKSGVWESRS